MITKEELHKILEAATTDTEGIKLDFKRDPWKFDSEEGKGELIKDVIAVANAPGEVGRIIIGVEELKEQGVTTYRPVLVSENPLELPLREEQLQQIAGSGIDPNPDLSYAQFLVVGYPVGVLEVYSLHRPYCVARNCGKVHKGQFFIRKGSTTAVATRDELRTWFQEELERENEHLRDQIEALEKQVKQLQADREPGDWTLDYLWSNFEHVRYLPCFLLEMWEKELSSVSADEISAEFTRRFGLEMSARNTGSSIARFSQRATLHNLDELIIAVDAKRGLWRLNEKYVSLVKRFRDEIIEEQGKADWTLEHFENVKAPTVRAIPCIFLENYEQTGSLTMTTDDVSRRIEGKLNQKFEQKASFFNMWTRVRNRHGLKSLFIREELAKWRLNRDYLDLVKQFCRDR